MARLETRLFGEIEVRLDGRPLRFPTQKAKELFAYLILHHRHAHSRTALAGLLWAESDEAKAKSNLRKTLSRLRQALGAEADRWLETSGGALRFITKNCWMDVTEFERLVGASHDLPLLEQAIALYRGPLLPGIYEDWALMEAERFQTLYLSALEELADRYSNSGAPEQAIRLWQRAIQTIPWHERAHRELMTLYAQLGDRVAALQQYREYVQIVERELNAAPLPEMRALAEQLAQRAPLTPTRAELLPIEMPFVGRERELDKLRMIWQNVLHGHGQALLISGEVGVGKTALVQHFLKAIDALSLQGTSYAAGSALPYQPLLQAVQARVPSLPRDKLAELSPLWQSELARFVPEIHEIFPNLPPNPELTPAQGKARWFAALTGFFEILSRERPILLFLDDLHWAESATLDYLGHLTAHLKGLRILVIGTYRLEEAHEQSPLRHWLDDLGPGRAYHSMTLSRLSEEETCRWVERLWAGVAREVPSYLYKETEGNPLFLREFAHSLVQSGLLQQDDQGHWKLVPSEISTDLPENLRELIYASLRRASQRDRPLLGLAAVMGRDFELAPLCAILRQPEARLLDRLDALQKAQLIVEHEGRYQFHHELVRQVVYSELSTERKRLCHRQIAQALEELYPQRLDELAGELSLHFERARQWEKAIAYSERAGLRAEQNYAYDEARKFFAKALKLCEKLQGPLTLRQQHMKLALLDRYTGETVFPTVSDINTALEEVQAAISMMMALARELGDEAKLSEAYQRQARVEIARGCREAAQQALHQALELNRKVSLREAPQAAATLESIGRLHRQLGKYSQALEDYGQLTQLGVALGDLSVQGKARAASAAIQLLLGQFTQAHENMQIAYELFQATGNRRLQASALNNLGLIQRGLGQLAGARTSYQLAYELMNAVGDQRGIGIVLINLGALAGDQGHYDEALGYLDQVLAMLHLAGLKGLEIETLSEKGRAHLGQGALSLALESSRRAAGILETEQGISTEAHRFYFTHFEILRANQRTDEARIYLKKAYQELRRVAEEIQEEDSRISFLENVPVNRQIIEAWQTAQQGL